LEITENITNSILIEGFVGTGRLLIIGRAGSEYTLTSLTLLNNSVEIIIGSLVNVSLTIRNSENVKKIYQSVDNLIIFNSKVFLNTVRINNSFSL
jgi:hypothetical protein